MKVNKDIPASRSAEFFISSSYKEFTTRQKNVFDQLNKAEHSSRQSLLHDESMNIDSSSEPSSDADDSTSCLPTRSETKMRQFRGKESIFKKPQARPPRFSQQRKAPDYQLNPHKWTRYSLGDVRSEDMTDRANTAAAMSFLKEMESRKTKADGKVEEVPQKITFKKVVHKTESLAATPIFRNSKILMPEYVVGQKIKVQKKERKINTLRTQKEVKLDHLQEDDEND